MYTVKHTNVICVTRNADLDATEGSDEADEDYREHMKRILKKRSRLAPVRLESERKLSNTVGPLLMKRLNLKEHQTFVTSVPLDMSYTYALAARLPEKKRAPLVNAPFTPQWPACLDRKRPVIDQVSEREVLLSYPYESMDPFVQLLREAAHDPSVISIKITLYRLARQSHLAEALIAAAEAGKEVTALFELRARFDESNNIEWSQRFEQAGCKVIYGFRDYKVHSKICCITRQTDHGLQHITQLGTGNYNLYVYLLHRPVVRHRRPHHRARRRRVLPQHGAGEHVGQLRHPVGSPAADQAPDPGAHRRADGACARRAALRAVLQDQLRDRQGRHREAGRGVAGRRAGDAARARHQLHRAGRGGMHRRRARGVHRRTPAGTQPHLRVRPARGHESVPVERRPHDAQHGQAHRDSLACAERRPARTGARVPGHLHGRHGEAARASIRPPLHAARLLRQGRRARTDGAVRFAAIPDRGGAAPASGCGRERGRPRREPQAHGRRRRGRGRDAAGRGFADGSSWGRGRGAGRADRAGSHAGVRARAGRKRAAGSRGRERCQAGGRRRIERQPEAVGGARTAA